MSNPFLKANPFSSGLPPPPASRYNNYLPSTSNAYDPSPAASRFEPPSLSQYSSDPFQSQEYNQPTTSLNNPFARDSTLGGGSQDLVSSRVARNNPFTRDVPSFGGGRESSPWRPSSNQ